MCFSLFTARCTHVGLSVHVNIVRVLQNELSLLSEDLKVWRTDPGSIFDFDPLEDNIQSKSLRRMSGSSPDPPLKITSKITSLSVAPGEKNTFQTSDAVVFSLIPPHCLSTLFFLLFSLYNRINT